MVRKGRDDHEPISPVQPMPSAQGPSDDERLANRLTQEGESKTPIRTVLFMEFGDLPPADARQALMEVSRLYGQAAHPTYVLPVRNGKLAGDIIFEHEILDFVRRLCTVADGNIVLKDSAHNIDVMRRQI